MKKKTSEKNSSLVSKIDIKEVKPGNYWYEDDTFSDEKIKGKKIKAVVELVENGVIYGNLTVSQLCKVERVVLRSWDALKEWIENFKYPFKPNEYLAWYTREQLLKVWQNKALVQKRIKPDGRHQYFEFTSTEVNSYCAYMLYFGKEGSYTKGNSTSYVPIIALKVS